MKYYSLTAIFVIGIAIGIACRESVVWLQAVRECERREQKRQSCYTRLCLIAPMLVAFRDRNDRYPRNLAELVSGEDPETMRYFVCPVTGHVEGSPDSIDSWSDYKYVKGHKKGDEGDGVVLFCPVENHSGNYGHVLTVDGGVLTLDKLHLETYVRTEYLIRTSINSSNGFDRDQISTFHK